MLTVRIPHHYTPRHYQLPFMRAMDAGVKRAVCVWHRRSGKSKTLLNFAIKKAFERVGVYYHAFPEYGQGRKIIWDGIDKDGFPLLNHIPAGARASINKSEMKIELSNGSIYQIIGADNYDSLVGPNPVGIILDEWAVSDRYPMAWDYFRPILAENGGWAVFPYTPRGRNHGFDLYQMSLSNPGWFSQLLTVDDTGAISQADIQAERDAGMSEEMIQQEFYCSFLASTEDIVIPFIWIQGALRREVETGRLPRLAGADPARFGNDRFGFVVRQGPMIIEVEQWRSLDIVQAAGRIMDRYRAKLFDAVAVDVIGIGAGVYDMLRNAGVPCVPCNVAESPAKNPERFALLRDELWWALRDWFQDMACAISPSIPDRERQALVADIQDIHYSYTPTGKIKVESKDDMKKRLGFSPDLGDALCCTFAPGLEMRLSEADRTPLGYVVNTDDQSIDLLRAGIGRH